MHPNAKILLIIREQVSWFSSLYKATITSLPPGQRSFHDYWITPQGIAMRHAAHHDRLIEAWSRLYPDMLILRYENLSHSSQRLCEWLGVEHIPFPAQRVNESHGGLAPASISAALPLRPALQRQVSAEAPNSLHPRQAPASAIAR